MADNLMQLFWDLSSLDDNERILSAKKIVTNLSDIQNVCESNELQYCVQRLVKGLASNRTGTRHGYFITLTEVLRQFPVLLKDVFKLIEDNLEHVGNAKAQEERGIYFGRVFAYLAVIESGTAVTPISVERISKAMIRVYRKKSYLQEFCAVSISRFIEELESELVHSSVLPYLGLDCGWEQCTPGKLYLLLTLLERNPNDEGLLQYLSLNWGCTDLISQNNLEDLSNVLMASSHSHPRIHVVWPVIIKRLRGGQLWTSFWNIVANDSLLISSHERKYLCYKLIEEFILPSLSLDEVAVVFSPRLIQQLENNGSTKHHLLHDAAKHFLEQFSSCVTVSTNPGVSLSLAMQIIRYKTGNVFSAAIRQLLNNITVDDLTKYVKYLISVLWSESVDSEKHRWMNQEMSMLFKYVSTSLKRNRGWLIVVAQFLLLQSLFSVLKPITKLNILKISESVSVTERKNYNEKLTNVITLLSDLKCVRGESRDQDNISCDLWPVSLVLYIEELMNEKESIELMTEVNMETWNKAIDVVQGLHQKEELRDCIDNAFLYLLSICLLDMIRNGGDKLADTIEEILVCYQKRTASLRKTPKRRKSVAPPTVSLDWLPVLMDLLLGLLSNHNQFWRNVTERVFLWLKGSLTYETIEVMIKAMEPQSIEDVMEREEAADTLEEEDEGMDIDAKVSKDVVECSDGQTSDNEGEGDKEGNGEDEGSNEEDEGSDEEDEGLMPHGFQDVGAEFRANVRNALGDLAAIDSDQESITSLDEEAMDTLDGALSAVFLKQKEKLLVKKQKKTDNMTVMHFKMRVLEFVGIYIRHQSTNPFMLEFLDPLLALVTKYNSHKTLSPLSERSRNLLDKLCRVKSYPKEGVDVNRLHLILKQLITKRLYSAQRLSPIVTQCCMFLLRVLKGIHTQPAISPMATRSTRKRRHIEKEKEEQQSPSFGGLLIDDVIIWCSTALNDMITDKNCNVHAAFFITLSERQPEIAWRLLPTLTSSLKCAGNHFRKIQGYNVLRAILGNYRLLTAESVIMLLKPVTVDLLSIMSQQLLGLSVPDTRLSHYLSLIEAFSDTVLTVQCYDELQDLLDSKMVSEVLKHLSSFSDHKVANIIVHFSQCLITGCRITK